MSITHMPFKSPKAGISRRNFLGLVLCAGLSGLSPKAVIAAAEGVRTSEKSLSLYNPHTKDHFKGVYWRDGKYVDDAVKNQVVKTDISVKCSESTLSESLFYSVDPFYKGLSGDKESIHLFLKKHHFDPDAAYVDLSDDQKK